MLVGMGGGGVEVRVGVGVRGGMGGEFASLVKV